MKRDDQLKSEVKERYSEIVKKVPATCGCGGRAEVEFHVDYRDVEGYKPEADYGLGCGIPTDGAGINPGDTVLDLGSGAGNDVFVARRLVGETGRVIGVDMTEAMVKKAIVNNRKAGYSNVEFRLGEIENIPVETESVEVVVSNCVLNLVPDKKRAFAEIMRVLKPGGHFSISDIVAGAPLPDRLREVAALYSGCVSGAMAKDDYIRLIREAGFTDIVVKREIRTAVPRELLAELTPAQSEAFGSSGIELMSVTVQARKPDPFRK